MSGQCWAKVHTEMLDDEKLIGRPDADFRLWVSLILFAKRNGDDGIIRGLDATRMRSRFWMQCKTSKVQDALEYFASHSMIRIDADGTIHLLHYEARQSVKDHLERNAERQRRWRERNAKRNSDPNVTHNGHVTTEEKRGEEIRSPLSPPSGGATQSHPFRRKAEPPAPLPKWKQQGASSPEEYERWLSEAKADHGT